MKQNTKVSIVTPCYNAEKYLPAYFESVMSQTFKNIELILVNDGSADQTDEVIDSYKQLLNNAGIELVHLSYPDNKGQAYALNYGLKYFTGDYLSWIDVDDQMTADCLEKKVSFLKDNPQYDYCVCKSLSINPITNETILYEPTVKNNKKAITESIIFSDKGYYVCGAYMVRRCFFDTVVKNREIFTGRGGQNAQMLIPCSWYGNPGYLEEILYKFYSYPSSHSHSINTPAKHVQQLTDLQEIIINTLTRTNDEQLIKYIPDVKKHYTRLRFGHSLDSKDEALIRECAKQLKELGIITNHDRYLVFRYTNKISKILFPV